MFQFPRYASLKLCVHLRVPQHYLRWVAPFGDLRVNACLRLTVAFRRLPRPSSAPGAKASALRPLYLDHFSLSCSYSDLYGLELPYISLCSFQGAKLISFNKQNSAIKAVKSLVAVGNL